SRDLDPLVREITATRTPTADDSCRRPDPAPSARNCLCCCRPRNRHQLALSSEPGSLVRFQTEATIERPRDEVFRRFTDELAQTIPLICPLTISVTLDSDKPIGAGTTGKMTLPNLFISYVVDFEVTRYEQHEQFSLEARYRTRST